MAVDMVMGQELLILAVQCNAFRVFAREVMKELRTAYQQCVIKLPIGPDRDSYQRIRKRQRPKPALEKKMLQGLYESKQNSYEPASARPGAG